MSTASLRKKLQDNLESNATLAAYIPKFNNKILKKTDFELLTNPLIRAIFNNDKRIKKFEEYLLKCEQVTKDLKKPLKKLVQDPLNSYYPVSYELQTALALVDDGYREVQFAPSNSHYDIKATKDSREVFIEVKSLVSERFPDMFLSDKVDALFSLCNYKGAFTLSVSSYSLKETDYRKAAEEIIKQIKKTIAKDKYIDQKGIYTLRRIRGSSLNGIHAISGDDWHLWLDDKSQITGFCTIILSKILTKVHYAYFNQLMVERRGDYRSVASDHIYVYIGAHLSSLKFESKDINSILKNALAQLGWEELVNITVIV